MHKNRIREFAAELVALAESVKMGDDLSPSYVISLFVEGTRASIVGPAAGRLRELCRKFYVAGRFSDKYSEDHVSNIVRDMLGKVATTKTQAKAESLIVGCVSEYEQYNKAHLCFVPLTGIDLQVRSVQFGNVRILNIDDPDIKDAFGEFYSIAFSKALAGPLLPVMPCIVGTFEVVAEPERAKELAIVETRRVMDIMRYAIPFIYGNNYKALRLDVNVVGDSPESICGSITIPKSEVDGIWFSHDHKRPAMPLVLSEKTLAIMDQCGASAIAESLGKAPGSLTDIESVLLRAVHWFGNALRQDEPENELLSLTTCLEAFLTPRDGNPVTLAIAEGVAILLGDKLEDRKSLKKRVKELYAKRSGVSHGGRKAVLESDLVDLREIARKVIHKVIGLTPQISSQEELSGMIEDARLGGDVTPSTPSPSP